MLWDIAPPLRLNSDRPCIVAGAIHLPARIQWQQHNAAAAHAAAHLVYSPCAFDGSGLGPMVRALMALLEDARAETLAIQSLPGLARLWRPLHTATPALGAGFESLMARLARKLIDPNYDDPEPWICKGQMLFFRDVHCQLLPGQVAAVVRTAAMKLGNDIGQMRLQFNARSYCPVPAYRDDHRWMWAADVLHSAPLLAQVAGRGLQDGRQPPMDRDAVETVTRYPEWDRLLGRMRLDWCSVLVQPALAAVAPRAFSNDIDEVGDGTIQQTALRLRRPLRRLIAHSSASQCNDEGETFDPGALVAWRVARRTGNAAVTQVYRGLAKRDARPAVWILIDQSASAATVYGSHAHSVIQTATASAIATATALQAMDIACTITSFSSYGRHAVRMVVAKSFAALTGNAMSARLHALQPGGSTRLGAALRHATSRLVLNYCGPRWVIVLTDGDPHDVDVHDPHYLIDDARHAVVEATRHGVRIVCPVLSHDSGAQAQRIFGKSGVQALHNIRELPGVLKRLITRGPL